MMQRFTTIELMKIFEPSLISIENNDYRGCEPTTPEMLHLWYRGTDILKTEVRQFSLNFDKDHLMVLL